MGGKQAGSSAPLIRPRGPIVSGPSTAGPPLLARVLGPQRDQVNKNMNSFKDTAAPIVGTVAGIIANYFAPGTGFFASKAADRTVREQVNVVNGRPFFEGVDNSGPKPTDLASIIGSLAGYAGSAAGGAAGGAAAGAAGEAAGSSVGGAVASTGVNSGLGALIRASGWQPGRPALAANNPYRRSLIYAGGY